MAEVTAHGLSKAIWSVGVALWATVALVALGPAVDALTPDIHPAGPEGPPRTPEARRTAHSGAPGTPPINPTDWIIEQHPGCWLGRPGATCGPERTYR